MYPGVDGDASKHNSGQRHHPWKHWPPMRTERWHCTPALVGLPAKTSRLWA
jgi:hypothetical protein